MNKILLKDAVSGDVLARDIYGFNDTLVLKKGSVLNAESIYSLILKDIAAIYIEEREKNIGADPLSEYNERIVNSQEFKEFTEKYDENLGEFEINLNNIVEKNANEDDIKEMVDKTKHIIAGCTSGGSVFDMLGNMKTYDDSTFAHCMNVSLICNVFAKWLGMNERQIELATTCGLFHDIGKVTIPPEIIKKPGKLTDEEYNTIKTHTIKGYEILKQYKNLADEVKYAALMHHEKCDGTGYPMGITGSQINDYAKIVAIADIYDAMTSARVYRGPVCPFKVIKIFEEDGLTKYEPRFILTFLENVADTYMQHNVQLSDGQVGKIIFINKNVISKPIVKCEDEFLDLSKIENVSIEKII